MDNGYKNLEQLKRECLIDSIERIALTLGHPINSLISPSNWVKQIKEEPFFLTP